MNVPPPVAMQVHPSLELPADPWQWEKLEPDAWDQLAFQSPNFGPTAPISQYAAVLRCKAQRAAVEDGDGFAVLACVRICGTSGLTMPDWLVSAFNRRYDAVLNCDAVSWDDPLAFGSPYPKSTNLNALKKRRIGRLRMWCGVAEAVKAGESVNKILFERLGEPYGYGKTLAENLYREALSHLALYDPVQARRAKTTPNEETTMYLFAAAAMAREEGRDRIDVGGGMHADYHNLGPTREPVQSNTSPSKKLKKPAISQKAEGLKKGRQ